MLSTSQQGKSPTAIVCAEKIAVCLLRISK
jgi:hypothetical protein